MILLLYSQLQQQVEGPFPLFHLNLNVAALWMMLYKKDKQDFSGACRVGTLIHVTILWSLPKVWEWFGSDPKIVKCIPQISCSCGRMSESISTLLQITISPIRVLLVNNCSCPICPPQSVISESVFGNEFSVISSWARSDRFLALPTRQGMGGASACVCNAYYCYFW